MDFAELEGKICDTCTASLSGKKKIKKQEDYSVELGKGVPFDNYHHQSYGDFVASKEDGCFICTWIWTKVLPVDSQSAALGFRIYCHSYYEERILFYVVCPWAADFRLIVRLRKKADFPTHAYGRAGSPPQPPWTELDAHPWSTLDPNIGSSQSLQTIQQWISSCNKNHEYCRPPSSEGAYFPSRALDVDKAELGTVHLCDRSQIEAKHAGTYPVYWTLSHRWGDPELIVRLLSTTEHQFRNGIRIDDLSPTFRDAVLVVHRLGYRYLWIDSLCIFQDSLDEWQQEAQAMVDVYRHSLCNISAAAASSDPGSSGLFRSRKLDARLLFPFKADVKLLERSGGVSEGSYIFWNESVWTDEVEGVPLSTRGWVVQERFLAPRVVHFAENQIYWECLEGMWCEADPEGELRVTATVYKTARLNLVKKQVALSGNLHPARQSSDLMFHSQWGSVVGIYTSCALTKESDRLIAMAGIAKTFREINGDTYLAGLWKRMIYTDLAWISNTGDGAQVRYSESYAPTWSWASVAGGNTTLNILRGKYSSLPAPLISIVDARIVTEPPGEDSTGPLRSAELDIECMLYYYRWVRESSHLAVYTDEARTQRVFEQTYRAGRDRDPLHLDTTDLIRRFAGVKELEGVCMPICGSYEGYGGGSNVYIMLAQDFNGRFRRIGLFQGGGIGTWISEWSGKGTRITLV
ncbi:hypothetical protein CCMSSC00406_0008864 [Pleurotus cornucopiae]|uniref:Uncharacterized protein n=1 Tax=Pleurotus cornucopiae TaxID=5321 RepID=A0ACB7INC5_PLECO|nr:hypothetical protein CCMSSC00406_0008864 [Pleurotus cornucopiae]